MCAIMRLLTLTDSHRSCLFKVVTFIPSITLTFMRFIFAVITSLCAMVFGMAWCPLVGFLAGFLVAPIYVVSRLGRKLKGKLKRDRLSTRDDADVFQFTMLKHSGNNSCRARALGKLFIRSWKQDCFVVGNPSY